MESRGRQVLYAITYTWNLKISTNELIYKRETDSQTRKTNTVTKVAGRYKLGV